MPPDPDAAPPLWQVPVTYGAIGGTQADDLLTYPPKGYRPIERRIRLGHGEARWEHAWLETMTWGIQKRSGIRVTLVDAPASVAEGTYTPVSFGHDGEPVAPASIEAAGEAVYAPDGSAALRPGDTAVLRIGLWPLDAPVRVVYVVDEPRRRGFGYGTLPGHPERGEEAWIIEHRADDSVWMTIRAFSRPAHWIYWVGYPITRLVQEIYTRRYERVLGRPIEGE
jgi:uncharacterized protein (UPF0548 family)